MVNLKLIYLLKVKMSCNYIGGDKITDFSGECTSGLKYRDYRDAFSNTHLIDENL